MQTNGYSAEDIVRSQRTSKGLAYEKLMKGMHEIRRSPQAKHKEMWKRLNEEIVQLKAVSANSVHANTYLSNMSVQYANDEYIGERLVGEVGVAKRSDIYAVFPKRERLEYPDDSLSARGQANELEESRSSDNYSVKDYGFSNYVGQDTVDNQDAIFDEMMDLVEAINEGIAFKRELRLATLLTTAGNYAGNTTAIAAASQWDSASGGDPIKNIQDMLSSMWSGRGASLRIGFTSLEVFNVLARHPHILDLLKYQRSGIAQRTEIANFFGLDDLLVGAARKQTANEGQTAAYSRIWGKVFGVVRVAKRPTKRSAHFASLFRLNGDPVTTEWFDPKVGKAGGHYAKVAVSEDAKVIAGDTGYLLTSVIS